MSAMTERPAPEQQPEAAQAYRRARPAEPPAAPPLGKLRRIALARQGLLRQAPFGRGEGAVLRTIEQLGYVQIDTISVVARAHHHVLHTRVENYRPAMLDTLLQKRKVHDYWAHAAAFLPMDAYRFALPFMARFRDGRHPWSKRRDPTMMARVLDRIRLDGPLRGRDFETPKGHQNGWWEWKPAKQALEQLFMQGDLMVIGREGLEKRFDLTERALPAHVDTRFPTVAEQADHLVTGALRAHGFVTLKHAVHGRSGKALRTAVKANLDAAVTNDQLRAFRLPSGMVLYADPEVVDTNAPRVQELARVLSPFDNAVIHRERPQALFAFDYQIECYLPAAKRRFGYFSLPILYRDALVARADCKAHREAGRFEVRALHFEESFVAPFVAPFATSPEPALSAISAALQRFATFHGCPTLTISHCHPRRWLRPLRALAQRSP